MYKETIFILSFSHPFLLRHTLLCRLNLPPLYTLCVLKSKLLDQKKKKCRSYFFSKMNQHQTNIIHFRKFLLIYPYTRHLNLGLNIPIWIMLKLTPLKWQYINQPSVDIECAFWRNFTLNY